MHTTRDKKKNGMVLNVPTFMEAYGKIRGDRLPQGQAFRDKRNDYRRKPKHAGRGWADAD